MPLRRTGCSGLVWLALTGDVRLAFCCLVVSQGVEGALRSDLTAGGNSSEQQHSWCFWRRFWARGREKTKARPGCAVVGEALSHLLTQFLLVVVVGSR